MANNRKEIPDDGTSGVDPFLIDVGERIRDVRKSRNMSQLELARASGIHQAYITAVENGLQNCTLQRLHLLARALKTPIRVFLPPAEDGPPSPELLAQFTLAMGRLEALLREHDHLIREQQANAVAATEVLRQIAVLQSALQPADETT